MLRNEIKESRLIESESISKVSLDHAMSVIKSLNGFAKILSVPLDSDKYLNFILEQLLNPETNRPTKSLKDVHRQRVYNPGKGEWVFRKVEETKRGCEKNTIFTKKTAVTLLPSDGVINLYTPKHEFPTGLLFDAEKCHLKHEKYIFLKNANTNAKWWLKKKGIIELDQPVIKGVTLSFLRNHLIDLRLKGTVPEWNEILAGLSLLSLVAVFAVNNIIEDRLRALYTQQKIKSYLQINANLNFHLPILIITVSQGIAVYDECWQDRDYGIATRWDFFKLPAAFVQRLKPIHDYPVETMMGHNEFGFDFLIDNLISDGLKRLIVDYLNFSDLIKIKKILWNNQGSETLAKQFENKVEKVRMQDLSEILLMDPDNCLQMDFPLDPCHYDTFVRTEPVLKIFRQLIDSWFGARRQEFMNVRLQFVERVLAHICYANLEEIIADILKRITSEHNEDLLYLIIHLGVNPIIHRKVPNIFYDVIKVANFKFISPFIPKITDYESLKCIVPIYGRCYDSFNESWYDGKLCDIVFSPILVAALSNKIETLQLLTQHFPNELLETLSNLKWVYYNYSNKQVKGVLRYELSYENITNAHTLLLLQLNSIYHEEYCLSYDEKRLVETYLIEEIKKLNSQEEISAFWNKHKDALYLTQHRHHFFWDKPGKMTTIKVNVQKKLEERRKELESSPNKALRP